MNTFRISLYSFLVFISTFSVTQALPVSSESAAPVDYRTREQQQQRAAEAVHNPGFTMMDAFLAYFGSASHIININRANARAIDFKDPVLSGGASYTVFDHDIVGGFDGDEVGANLAFDAHIADGLVAGVLYHHTARDSRNEIGTNEDLSSHGFSIYAGKRYFDLLNVGAAYNYLTTDHDLSGTVVSNLDRDSHGLTLLAGVSGRKNLWSWASTASFSYLHDNYEAQVGLDTGRFGLSNGLNYDLFKWMTAGVNLSYYNFIHQAVFPGATRTDDDYWTAGPRFSFFPTDRLALNLDFDAMLGYQDYESQTIRVSADYSF
jgi:hypothetical protein